MTRAAPRSGPWRCRRHDRARRDRMTSRARAAATRATTIVVCRAPATARYTEADSALAASLATTAWYELRGTPWPQFRPVDGRRASCSTRSVIARTAARPADGIIGAPPERERYALGLGLVATLADRSRRGGAPPDRRFARRQAFIGVADRGTADARGAGACPSATARGRRQTARRSAKRVDRAAVIERRGASYRARARPTAAALDTQLRTGRSGVLRRGGRCRGWLAQHAQ